MANKSCCGSNSSSDGSDIEAQPLPTGIPLNQNVFQPTTVPGCPPTPNPGCTITPCCSTTTVDPCAPQPCGTPFTSHVQVLQKTCRNCSCNPCKCQGQRSTGCCNPPANTSCQPYYSQVSMCPEDNRKSVVVKEISQVFRNRNAFAMPECGAKIDVVFQGVTDVAIGAWLWAFSLGFLEVEGFNPYTGAITVSNPCPTNCGTQAPPGTPVPACSMWVLTIPVCPGSGGTGTFPCLDSGFIAPVSGGCVQIAVTNVNGLSVNKNVSIETGIYRISAINSATIITICNDGQGLTPGTNVDPGPAGNCAVPIVLIDNNPCLNNQVLCGAILGCNGGVTSPVVGTEVGQVLVYNGNGNSCFRTLGIPVLNCTDLTVCLTLDPDLPSGTSYLVIVGSTADFTVGDIVTIGGITFTVDVIIDGTHMRIIPTEDPVAIITFPAGSTLCSADCCTILDARVTKLERYVYFNENPDCVFPGLTWLDVEANQADTVPITPTVVNAGSPLVETAILNITIENNSCVNGMGVHFTIDYLWEFNTIAGAAGDANEIELIGQYNVAVANAPVPPVPVDVYHGFDTLIYGLVPGSTGICRYFRAATISGFIQIPIFNSAILALRTSFNYGHGTVANVNVQQLSARVAYMAVAIPS